MDLLRKITRFAIWLFYKTQYKIVVEGYEKLPKDKGYVMIVNHINAADPMIVGISVPFKVNFMAKKELFKNPILGFILSKGGVFPVDRDSNDISAIKTAIRVLKNKEPLMIFPEGTRNNGCTPLPSKSGAALIAYKVKAPIVPVMVDSTYKRFSLVRVRFYDPISTDVFESKPTNEDLSAFTEKILDNIYSDLVMHREKCKATGGKN